MSSLPTFSDHTLENQLVCTVIENLPVVENEIAKLHEYLALARGNYFLFSMASAPDVALRDCRDLFRKGAPEALWHQPRGLFFISRPCWESVSRSLETTSMDAFFESILKKIRENKQFVAAQIVTQVLDER